MTVQEAVAVPFVDLVSKYAPLRAKLLEAMERVLDHGQFILGPEVTELEARWARLCGARHAVGVSNGTMALLLVLKTLGIGPGDSVITAPNSFVSSASCIALVGGSVRFADVGDDFNIDPRAVRKVFSERTKAVIAVHLAGRPADVDRIQDVAATRGVAVVEDAAQAFGAKYRGRQVGSLARAACFSLHPLKIAGACGDAGMITTNDSALAERIRRLRNHGFDHRQEDCSAWGYNARMDTLQAALALVMLEHLDEWIHRRRAHAAIYRERLAGLVRMPMDRETDFAVYQTFPVEAERRDELVAYLKAEGIGCAVHYRVPIHLLKASQALGYHAGDLPVAERQARHVMSLPVHETLSLHQVHRVCDAISAFYRRA